MSPPLPAGPRTGKKREDSNRTGEIRVLLVQRRPVELQIVASMLDILGCHVTPVAESGKALLYCGKDPFELLACDFDMPNINGFRLAYHIRNHSPQTRVLLMTAGCQAEVAEYMDSKVVDGWLFKPFRLNELSDMMKSMDLL